MERLFTTVSTAQSLCLQSRNRFSDVTGKWVTNLIQFHGTLQLKKKSECSRKQKRFELENWIICQFYWMEFQVFNLRCLCRAFVGKLQWNSGWSMVVGFWMNFHSISAKCQENCYFTIMEKISFWVFAKLRILKNSFFS